MQMNMTTTRITLWLNRFVMLLVALLLPGMPYLLHWYSHWRVFTNAQQTALMVAFYICAAITAVALWSMDGLLRNILQQEVFTGANVRKIRTTRWCCGLISLVCVPVSFVYYPLFFMVVIMAFLCLVISVLVKVMAAAVAIREENELTV